MRGALRWSIAIIGTVGAFSLATWLSALAGTDEGWALGLGALAAALMLAGLQTWATTHRSPQGRAEARLDPADTTADAPTRANIIEPSHNEIGGAPEIEGGAFQFAKFEGDFHYHAAGGTSDKPTTGKAPAFPIRVGDIPRRPPAFQPRTELYHRITDAGRIAVVQALTGARGVGKTQLAAEYARTCMDDGWPVVAWITAEDPEQITAGLAELGDELRLRAPGDDSATMVRKVRRWLETRAPEHTLVVFDNAMAADLLAPLLPVSGRAQVVITSNHHAFENLGVAVDIDVFNINEALAFLSAKTGLVDKAGARDLVEQVGCLPLALDQSASVIKKRGLSYQMFLARLQQLPVKDYLERRAGDAYPRSVAESVLLALGDAESDDALARSLVDLLAVLSPAGVGRDLLYAAVERGIVPGDANAIDLTLGMLADVSLIAFGLDGQSVIMHRFTQRIARDRAQKENTLIATINVAAQLLRESLVAEHQTWAERPIVDQLVLQIGALWDSAITVLPVASQDSDPASSLVHLRYWAVWYLRELANLAGAIRLGRELLADAERILGSDHPNTLASRNELAIAYRAAGHLDEAITLHERNLTDRERILGPDHPQTLTNRNNLANAYRDAGRPDKAVTLHERNLSDSERILGPDHRDTLISRNALAVAYRVAGHFDKALTVHIRNLSDSERILGPDHPQTLASRNALAAAYRDAGDFDKAIALYKRNLSDSERILGPDHPDLLQGRNNLAETYRAAGRLDEAIALFEQTLEGCERALGPGHRLIGVITRNLEATRLKRARET
jgi:tetratricopeptide (TPR) repeat protein